MLIFSQRIALCKLFRKWCQEKGVLVCEESFLAWLIGHGALKEDKCREIIIKQIEDQGEEGEQNG